MLISSHWNHVSVKINAKCIILVLPMKLLLWRLNKCVSWGRVFLRRAEMVCDSRGLNSPFSGVRSNAMQLTQISVGWIKTSRVSSDSIWLRCFTAWDLWSAVAFCVRWQLVFLKRIWSIPRWHLKLQAAVPFKITVWGHYMLNSEFMGKSRIMGPFSVAQIVNK